VNAKELGNELASSTMSHLRLYSRNGSHNPSTHQFEVSGGLTKREAFAMAALQGLCANPQATAKIVDLAGDAVKMADALLAELCKENA
jgi:hypothetical protein